MNYYISIQDEACEKNSKYLQNIYKVFIKFYKILYIFSAAHLSIFFFYRIVLILQSCLKTCREHLILGKKFALIHIAHIHII